MAIFYNDEEIKIINVFYFCFEGQQYMQFATVEYIDRLEKDVIQIKIDKLTSDVSINEIFNALLNAEKIYDGDTSCLMETIMRMTSQPLIFITPTIE